MSLQVVMLNGFATWILGATPWGQIQGIIKIVEDPNKPGPEKRAEALAMAEQLGIGLAGWLLNLGIELGVAYLRTQNPAAGAVAAAVATAVTHSTPAP